MSEIERSDVPGESVAVGLVGLQLNRAKIVPYLHDTALALNSD